MGDAITATVREIVRRHPDAPARSLARRVVAETNHAITLEQARCRVRAVLGVQGAINRRKIPSTQFRPPRVAGQTLSLPPTKAKPWTPHDMGVVGRIGVLSDVHVPYHDVVAVQAAVRHLQAVKVNGLLLNGDIADFYSISHWVKRPSERDFPGELRAVRDFLGWLRQEFPKVPIVLKLGNHEERFEKWLWQHAAEISDEPEMGLDVWLRTARLGITIVDDQRPVLLGELPVLHGHELPRGVSSPVNPARGAFMRTKHTVLVGHQHQTSGHCEPDMWHKETFVWSTGCLCDLTPEYARLNRWNLGFAVVTVERDGQFNVANMRIAGDVVRTS